MTIMIIEFHSSCQEFHVPPFTHFHIRSYHIQKSIRNKTLIITLSWLVTNIIDDTLKCLEVCRSRCNINYIYCQFIIRFYSKRTLWITWERFSFIIYFFSFETIMGDINLTLYFKKLSKCFSSRPSLLNRLLSSFIASNVSLCEYKKGWIQEMMHLHSNNRIKSIKRELEQFRMTSKGVSIWI